MSLGESTHDLAVALEPTLRAFCDDRLGPVEWFVTAQQRGGAATGLSVWHEEHTQTPVVVKLPVGPAEFAWSRGLGVMPDPIHANRSKIPPPKRPVAPRVFAGDQRLSGYDLAWLVIERLGSALDPRRLDKPLIRAVFATVARFHDEAARLRPIDGKPVNHDVERLIEMSREAVRDRLINIEHLQQWNELLKRAQKVAPGLVRRWQARPINAWCHGDVHAANVMREGEDDHTCDDLVLIDMGLVHAGCWIEDALYFERQYWAHPEALQGVKPVQALARARRDRGLDNGEDYAELAHIRRLLLAACVPALYADEGTPAYANAALERLEQALTVFA